MKRSGKEEGIAAKEEEIAGLQRALSDERQRVSSLNEECATLKGSLEGKTEEVQSLQAHVRTLQVWRSTLTTSALSMCNVDDHYYNYRRKKLTQLIPGIQILQKKIQRLRQEMQ